jgi:hypothetical protein
MGRGPLQQIPVHGEGGQRNTQSVSINYGAFTRGRKRAQGSQKAFFFVFWAFLCGDSRFWLRYTIIANALPCARAETSATQAKLFLYGFTEGRCRAFPWREGSIPLFFR